MKRFLLIPLLLSVILPGAAVPAHRDMGMTSIGAQTRRTEVVFWPTAEEALGGRFEQSPNYFSLNGEWDFAYTDDDRQEPAWTKIRVPGNWEVQGFGTAIYVNIPYEFAPKDPQPPILPEDIPVGRYRRTFRIPEGWAGREVYLNLAGAKSGVYVSVNGREAGYCEDSKSLARFDITPLLQEGENEILLTIYRWSTGSFLECQDFWRLSGIERDVYLSSEARRRDFDFEVVSTLDEALKDGQFRLTVYDARDFAYKLLDEDGRTVLQGRKSGNEAKDVFTGTVPGVRMEVDGEWTRFSVGFRRLEITRMEKNGREFPVFLVNGQPVKFKGVNTHEHDPRTGHYVTRELVLRDLQLMKSLNINAIRTCHYPQPRFFYELCDSLGFYVYDEANIESHGMGYSLDRTLGNNPAWYAKHFDRAMNMYRRTGNYPCVTILSLGNEAGNGVNFYKLYTALKELEKDGQNRPPTGSAGWANGAPTGLPSRRNTPTPWAIRPGRWTCSGNRSGNGPTCRADSSGTGWTRDCWSRMPRAGRISRMAETTEKMPRATTTSAATASSIPTAPSIPPASKSDMPTRISTSGPSMLPGAFSRWTTGSISGHWKDMNSAGGSKPKERRSDAAPSPCPPDRSSRKNSP